MFARTELLLGKTNIDKLKNSTVIVFGIGGVGSYVVDALTRVGVGKIVIVDKDDIPSEWFLPLPEQQRILEVTQAVVAPSMDVKFSHNWQGLERLAQAGEVIAWADGQAVVTPYDNCTLIMPSLRQLLPGVTVVRLARDYKL